MRSIDPDEASLRAKWSLSPQPVPWRGASRAAPVSRQGRDLAIVAGICAVAGVMGWVLYGWGLREKIGQDWMVFYTAAAAFLDGNLPLILHAHAFTDVLISRFSGWLGAPLNLHPWVYPPPYLLLFLPFGLPSALFSFIAFVLAGFVAACTAAWLYARTKLERWLLICTLILCPAVPFDVMTGQNAFYTSAILLGGFGLLGRAPLAAGLLLGVLSFKPQLCLMVPVALVAARQWRALATAAAMAFGLALASAAVFGIHFWQAWFELVSGHDALYRAWLLAGRLKGQSIFACATLMGAPSDIANIAQTLAIAFSAGFVYWSFVQRSVGELEVSGLLTATMLSAPHASDQDGILLGLAAVLSLCALMRDGYRWYHPVMAVAVWISPLLNPPALFRIGLITPVLLIAFLASIGLAIRRREPSAGASPG